MPTKRYLVSGRVQGVGFRNYTQKKARQVGINGTVRNLPDGRVEVIAQAEGAKLEQFEIYVRRGPMSSQVSGVEVIEENGVELPEGFDILW